MKNRTNPRADRVMQETAPVDSEVVQFLRLSPGEETEVGRLQRFSEARIDRSVRNECQRVSGLNRQ